MDVPGHGEQFLNWAETLEPGVTAPLSAFMAEAEAKYEAGVFDW